VLAIGTINAFKAVLLTDGKPSINAGQFMTAIPDELDRRTDTRLTLLEDIQKLYKINWPPVGSDELVLFAGRRVCYRLTKRFGLSTRSIWFPKVWKVPVSVRQPSCSSGNISWTLVPTDARREAALAYPTNITLARNSNSTIRR